MFSCEVSEIFKNNFLQNTEFFNTNETPPFLEIIQKVSKHLFSRVSVNSFNVRAYKYHDAFTYMFVKMVACFAFKCFMWFTYNNHLYIYQRLEFDKNLSIYLAEWTKLKICFIYILQFWNFDFL